nr:hypothetical protein [Tanacetum cinerariifolium]
MRGTQVKYDLDFESHVGNKMHKAFPLPGKGHAWMFDLDYLTNSINYEPVLVENQANKSAGLKEANNSADTQVNDDQDVSSEEIDLYEEYFILPIWSAYSTTVKSSSIPLSTTGPSRAFNDGELSYPDDTSMPHLKDIYASPSEGIFTDSSYDDEGVVTEFNNLEITVSVSLTPTTRIHTIHPKIKILRDPMLAVQTRSKVNKNSKAHALSAFMYGTIDEEVYVSQSLGFVDPKFHDKVYKVLKALYSLHQAPKACTPIETQKPLVKDEKAANVDVYLYRFQVTPKTSHLQAVKRIFRNPVFHSKTKHIEIRHHFIKDAYENKLIQVLKIYTDDNVADLLTKAFDVSSTGRQQLSTARHKVSTAGIKNAQFHEIVDFLLRSLIFYALTVSPDVCASFIEQFWKTKTFKTITNINQINAKVAGKPVVITEASIRGDLLFDDVDRIDCLTNEAIFENLALMGYEGDLTKLTFQKALFSPQ